MNQTTILAWHFTARDRLRDGNPVPPIGEKLTHEGPLTMCRSGLHASTRLMDALGYAPGAMLHRVECAGETITEEDKLVCRERTIIWSLDAEPILREFARWCALEVIDLWDAPDVVREFLETGDATLRAAARAAVRAARAARATRATRAAWDAAWAAQDAAAWDAARAARAAVRAARAAAAWDAAWAAQDAAAGAAAGAAARAAQEAKLIEMVETKRAAAKEETTDGQ